jgi:hypothetical protein
LVCDEFSSWNNKMRMTALAFAAVAALGITLSAAAPAVAQGIHISTDARHHGEQSRHRNHRAVIVHRRHDNGLHRGWSHSRGHAKRVVIIDRRGRH